MKTFCDLVVRLPRSLLVGAALSCAMATSAWAMPVTQQLVVTVIRVCDDAGANCASTGPAGNAYFEAETDKIWAQAGIDVSFVSAADLWSTSLLNGSSGIDAITGGLAGPGTTMYLMNTIAGVYGNAWGNAGGLAIAMDSVMSFNGGIGRLDTIAHELGHNLGLYFGAGSSGGHDNSNPNFLIASGGIRNVPTSLGDICPDGGAACRALLSADHIATAMNSHLLIPFVNAVPEPGAWALVGIALLGAGISRRRRA